MELRTLSIEVWRDALVAENTEAFLSVVRNYVGHIPTPYNKHGLVSRLEAFLKRPETGEAQAALLDSFDAEILGVLKAVGPCPESFFRELFSDTRTSWEVSTRLANLRDRLVLFRAPGPHGPVLAVAPPLAERLGREADMGALLGYAPAEESARGRGVSSDSLCVVASALFHDEGSLRKDGRPSKRLRERVLALAPELSESWEGQERIDSVISGFMGAGVLSVSGDGALSMSSTVDMALFAAAAGAWGERLPYFVAAASAGLEFRTDVDLGPLEPYVRISERARFLETVAALVPEGRAVSRQGLRRLSLLAGFLRGAFGASQSEYAVGALLRFGILKETPSGVVRTLPPAGPRRARTDGHAAGARSPVLVVEASHAIQVLPEADAAARAFAVTVARLESRGEVWSCVLDRESVRGALDAGFESAEIVRGFEELSGGPLPQSLSFSLAGWEKEYQSVRLYEGTILVTDGPARTIAENAPALAGLRGERVAEGVWLLRTENTSEIRTALEKSGLRAPRVRHPGGAGSAWKPLPPVPGGMVPSSLAEALQEEKPGRERRPEDRIQTLNAALDALGLARERRDMISERVSRRLILTEEQLSVVETAGGGLEAGALDYLGKVRVVERVLSSGDALLDILYRRADGEPERLRLRPLEIEKDEKGLLMRAADPEDGSVRVLPISALSHVRMIKTTLFGEEK